MHKLEVDTFQKDLYILISTIPYEPTAGRKAYTESQKEYGAVPTGQRSHGLNE